MAGLVCPVCCLMAGSVLPGWAAEVATGGRAVGHWGSLAKTAVLVAGRPGPARRVGRPNTASPVAQFEPRVRVGEDLLVLGVTPLPRLGLLLTDGDFSGDGRFHSLASWDGETVMKLFREEVTPALLLG